jgi:hypothetical protein
MEIEITKIVSGPELFRASIKGDCDVVEEGSSSSEALGELVRRHPERFGVTGVFIGSKTNTGHPNSSGVRFRRGPVN